MSKTAVSFLERLVRNAGEIYTEEHWQDKDVKQTADAMMSAMREFVSLYKLGYITEYECVKMIFRKLNGEESGVCDVCRAV